MKSNFKVGDNVRLKGQTKIMSVESLVDLDAKDLSGFKKVMVNNQRAMGMQTGDVICTWFDFDKVEWAKQVYHPDELELAPNA